MQHSPPFGTADLTNCERELIHLAGSTQPHGLLLVVRAHDLQIAQATSNVGALLGVPVQQLLERPLSVLGGDVEARLRELLASGEPIEPLPLNCRSTCGPRARELEGMVHRIEGGALVLELEPVDGLDASAAGPEMVGADSVVLMGQLAVGVQRFNDASTVGLLADAVVKTVRDMTGYDRVMVYKFDPDGHGKIIAEARHPRLDSLLGHHYPSSDIPQRARELYLRTRVRVLVDAAYVPAPLVPARLPLTGGELDMSLCYLRSMSPMHTQYLRNMGVTATLVVSLVREGRLWGLIAAHHYAPRNLRHAVRAAAELLGSVASTRIAAIENYAHAQVAILVRQLEQRLIDATSTEGDWRLALFRNPRTLLQPLDATGAALFHDGEVLTTGEVPSTPELRALLQWVDGSPRPRRQRAVCVLGAGAHQPGLGLAHPGGQRRAGGEAVDHTARLPDVVPQGATAHGHLGWRSGQTGDRQRPTRAVTAALVRGVVRDRARHRCPVGGRRDCACAGRGQRTRGYHRAGARRAPAGG